MSSKRPLSGAQLDLPEVSDRTVMAPVGFNRLGLAPGFTFRSLSLVGIGDAGDRGGEHLIFRYGPGDRNVTDRFVVQPAKNKRLSANCSRSMPRKVSTPSMPVPITVPSRHATDA
jgi:hypothetical protein